MSFSEIENGSANDIEAGPKTDHCVPTGDYKIIMWNLSLTGRRIIDEMCHITASVAPGGKTFSQYVMPYRKPDLNSQRRNGFAVVTIGRYRALRDRNTGKILRTKSEISALMDFLGWLEKNRGKDGILLLSYEPRKLIPFVLLEALRRYNLMDNFNAVVKGFVNGYTVAEAKCLKPGNSLSLHNLARVHLGKDAELATSVETFQAIYEVVQLLCVKAGSEGSDNADAVRDSNNVAVALREFALSVDKEEEDLSYNKGLLTRQATFGPVFGPLVQVNRRLRQNASVQKQLLAEAGLDYVMLSEAFKGNGKQGLAELMEAKLKNVSSKVCHELLILMENHFDPPAQDVITVPITEQDGEDNKDGKVPANGSDEEKAPLDKQNGEFNGNKVTVSKQIPEKIENIPVGKHNGEEKGKKVTIAKQNGEQKGEKTKPKQHGEPKGDKLPVTKQNGERKEEGRKKNGDHKEEGKKRGVGRHNGVHKGEGDQVPVAKLNGEHKGGDTVPVAEHRGEGDNAPCAKLNGENNGENALPVSKLNGEHMAVNVITEMQTGLLLGDPKQNGDQEEIKEMHKTTVDTVAVNLKTDTNVPTVDEPLKSEALEMTNGGSPKQ